MDGFLYVRVQRPAIQRFARLAINSNDSHPAHQRDATRPPSTASLPVTPSQLYATLASVLSPASPPTSGAAAAASVPAPFPAPLLDLIVQYALCSAVLAVEADGALHELWRQDGSSRLQHSRALHADALTAVASLPDGQHCATASHDGRIVVARQSSAAEDGSTPHLQEVRRMEHKHAVHALQGALAVDALLRSADSSGSGSASASALMSALVVGSSAGVFVYDPSTGRMLNELSGHTSRVSALCVLPGSPNAASVVVSASWDGCCRVWSLQSMQCQCVLRGRGRSLTCVAAADRGCVVAGDVTGGVSVWQFAAAMRTSVSVPSQQLASMGSADTASPPPAVSSSIASIRIAGHTATSPAYVFRSPETRTPAPAPVAAVQPSAHFSASSAACRSVLSAQSSGLLWVGSDDGLRLFAASESGEWQCLRLIVTASPRGSSCLPVHSLLWLTSCRMAVGMNNGLEVWNCQSLLEKADVESAQQVHCEWMEMNAMRVRSLTVRHWVDMTQTTEIEKMS